MDEWGKAGAPYMTEKDWVKLCMIIADHDLDNLGSVMSTCHKLSARKVKAEAENRAQAANMRADERAARRQSALEAGVPEIPDETALALHPPCSCGYELAACRACNNGWKQIHDREYLAEETAKLEGRGDSQRPRTPMKKQWTM